MAKTNRQRRILIWVIVLVGIVFTIPLLMLLHTVGSMVFLRMAGHGNATLVPYARGQLQSKKVYIRDAAARALGQIGPKAAPAVPDLLYVLREDSPQAAANAAWALGNIHSPQRGSQLRNPEVVDALIDALDHSDGEVRRYAAYAIGLIGPAALSAVPKLTQRLGDAHVSYTAARALGEMGAAARNSIPAMTALLSSSNPGDRAEAALALANLAMLGPLPAETVAAIKKLLDDDVDFVRAAASKAFSQLQP